MIFFLKEKAGKGDLVGSGGLGNLKKRRDLARLEGRFSPRRRRPADMERAHGQLRTRLTNRLRRDDTNRLTHVDLGAAGQIAAIAPVSYTHLTLPTIYSV
eukprot:TRINITY_DN20845_c0_g1_i1.p1 TRINITY_DN20845_c0_g1~~TRINITY_DN20845_c0_g1_i1.p1  ORF type:complete len:100 (-),score=14.64 TRINITY_DN20845_c0_g1_i1:160-459(-)